MKVCNFLCFFSLTLAAYSQATDFTNLERLVKLSEGYLSSTIERQIPKQDIPFIRIQSQPLDHRLQLTPCVKPLTFSHQSQSNLTGTVSVKVSCHEPHQWAIYTRHNISLEKEVAVAATHLPKNHIITEQDISYVIQNVYRLRDGFTSNAETLTGQQVKTSIRAGNIIYQSQLTAPFMVKKGDAVNIIAKIGSLSVVSSGIALKSGRKGEQIRIENSRSSRVIHGKVTGPNTVVVLL